MKQEYRKEFSRCLDRDMEYKIFGRGGKLCLAFPPQDGRFFDFENFKMIEALAPEIDAGALRVVCVDGIDTETWSAAGKRSPRERILRHEQWFHYVTDELVPRLRADAPAFPLMMTTGCSMGAYHAANFFFRAPQIFDTVVALSGFYHASFFFGDYSDDLVYLNSPIDCLPNMPETHPFMALYRRSKIFLCVGQGAWEDGLIESTRQLGEILRAKNIPATVDFWGRDVNHDWVWWRKQIRYFIQKIPLRAAPAEAFAS